MVIGCSDEYELNSQLGNWKYTVQWKDVIAAHPETTFVIQHFGGYLFDGQPVPQEYLDFCRDMAALPNTFVKRPAFSRSDAQRPR